MTDTVDSIQELKDKLIDAAVQHVPFDGWSAGALRSAAGDLGISASEATGLFPRGARDMIAWHSMMGDRRLMAELDTMALQDLKIRDRIATAVMTRLRQNLAGREAIRRALTILAMPQNAPLSMKLLYQTVDVMWRAAGDTSTDWNFYSKRGLLGAVYSSTLMVWINDDDPDLAETESFLHRRIADVMKVPKITSKLSAIGGGLPKRMNAFRRFASRRPGRGFRSA